MKLSELSEKQFRMLNELRMTVEAMRKEFIDNTSYEDFVKDLQIFNEMNFEDIESILEDNLNEEQF